MLIFHSRIVPESPRWLVVSKKDYPSALTTFERIAKSNKKSNDCLKKFEIFNKEGKHDQYAKASRVAEEKNQVNVFLYLSLKKVKKINIPLLVKGIIYGCVS
jgi:hypothetical protein